ncbi:hypothetical protein EV426DRAFT_685185 [Tirmania nivea]|nr:hypothetical protein EV426DRAFT_685185 [Tirmania nivea]
MVKIAITGTPGIGKSCFLLYFILRLLYESTDDEPNIVKFHPEPNVCYCYYGTELAHTGSYNDFTNFLDIPNVWYLSDNEDGPPERVLAKTIVALSPRKGINACPRFHKFFKDVNRSGKLCMPLWSFEEISDCREGIFSDLSEDVVSELFDKAGGVPRSILLKPSREKEPKTAVEAGLEDIEDGLEDIEDALRHLPTRFTTFKDLEELEYVAKEGFLGENKEPSKDEVDDMMDIVDKADEEMDEAGCLVEEVDQVKDTAMPGLAATKHIDPFLLPGRRNFPAIDLIRWPKTKQYIELFQITTSRVHPIKLDKLQEVIRVLELS